jgi:hypothetical protein
MGKPVSPGQALQILSVLSLNTDWSQFDADDLQQRFVQKPAESGAAFTAWLKNGTAATPTAKSPTLVLHKTIALGDIEGKRTGKCLVGKPWCYRDSDIDRWLPAVQPAQATGQVDIYQLQNPQGTTFQEMAAAALKVGPGTALDLLAKALKEQRRTFTLPIIEAMVKSQESGEDVGLRTDGYANFFFVEDSSGSVSVLFVNRDDGGWRGYVSRLDSGSRWDSGYRLVLRNSDASVL